MATIANQYRLVSEGKMSESQFLRNVRLALPKFVTNTTSYKDAVRILKNKSVISEAYVNPESVDTEYNPQEYDLGMRYEIGEGADEDKAEKTVLKNLAKNPSYYTQLHLAGYNEDAMKTSKKKRTDLPVEVKENVEVESKDILTEEEIEFLVSKVLSERDNNK